MRVLVTGANGFVGRHLVDHLAGARHTVVAATRDAQSVGVGPRVEHVTIGEVDRATDWRLALQETDAVVHLVSPPAGPDGDVDERDARSVILDGTRALADQALTAGVRRFVFMSSVKAMGEGSGGEPLRIDTTAMPASRYGAAKLEAERMLVELTSGTDMVLSVLRPPVIYGPGNLGNIPRLIRMLDRHPSRAGLLLGARNKRAFIFIGNLVAAVAAALGRTDKSPRCFLPRDPENVSTAELARLALRHLDHPVPGWHVPEPLARVVVRTVYGRAASERLFGSLELDDTETRTTLGWHPSVDLNEGIGRTVAWMRETGVLARRV